MSLITRPEIVVNLLPHRMIVGKVRVGRHTFLMEKSEGDWDESTLPDIFAEIKNTFHTDTIRLLLDDALCHTITVDLPTRTTNLREYLRDQIESRVGETPGPAEWDYKKAVFPLGKKDKAIVFVPHTEILKAITQAANRAELTIVAMEPTKIAQKRDEDPMIGIALKEDLRGEDEEILNISVRNPQKKRQGTYILVLSLILLTILAILGVLGYLAYQNFFAGSEKAQEETSVTATPPTVQREASPTPPPEPAVKLSDYKVQILNGSGITGRAGDLKSKMNTAGFTNVTAGNASRFNYTGVTIQSKVGTPKKVLDTITPLLGTVQSTTGEALSTTSTYDVVITLGK